MTVHNKAIQKQNWRAVKAKIIARFGTVKDAASSIKCHPNAIRYSTQGLCPHVKIRLEKALE